MRLVRTPQAGQHTYAIVRDQASLGRDSSMRRSRRRARRHPSSRATASLPPNARRRVGAPRAAAGARLRGM